MGAQGCRVLLGAIRSNLIGEGDGVTDFANSAVYRFPKHPAKDGA